MESSVKNTPDLIYCYIFGVLEFENDPASDITFRCQKIFIDGGRLIVGDENNPFKGLAKLLMLGRPTDPEIVFQRGKGPTVGTKAIGTHKFLFSIFLVFYGRAESPGLRNGRRDDIRDIKNK